MTILNAQNGDIITIGPGKFETTEMILKNFSILFIVGSGQGITIIDLAHKGKAFFLFFLIKFSQARFAAVINVTISISRLTIINGNATRNSCTIFFVLNLY